ncbi:GUN4 domain-containing protein [Pseudanabaena biceps]|nr:GUN4 domain-containing protein [Pseudanabaena biceps]
MDSEEILIEFVAKNGDQASGTSIKSIHSTKIKDSIQRLASLVQKIAAETSPSHANGLALDEVEISVKLTESGEVVLLGDGQSHGAMTMRFRRSHTATAIASPDIAPQAIKSKSGVDYTNLKSLLASAKWQEANLETWNVMCQAAHKNLGSVLSGEDIKRISCDDLQMIDSLWQQYSQGRYGFSTQNQVYMSSILG